MGASDLAGWLNGAIGAFGVLAIVFALVITETLLVTKARFEDMRQQRDDWKKAAETNQSITEAVLDANGGATRDVLRALQRVAIDVTGKPQGP